MDASWKKRRDHRRGPGERALPLRHGDLGRLVRPHPRGRPGDDRTGKKARTNGIVQKTLRIAAKDPRLNPYTATQTIHKNKTTKQYTKKIISLEITILAFSIFLANEFDLFCNLWLMPPSVC